jgi:hypothetical protein
LTGYPHLGFTYGLWGSSSQDMYFVGEHGSIVHWDGHAFQQQASGTDFTLGDICGQANGERFAAGADLAAATGIILRYDGSSWEPLIEGRGADFDSSELFKTQLYGDMPSLWTSGSGPLIVAGEFAYRWKDGAWDFVPGLTGNALGPRQYYFGSLWKVRGSSPSDVILAGQSETLLHYNGSTWQAIGTRYHSGSTLDWLSVSIKGDLAVAVGSASSTRPAAMILKRR